MKRFKLLMASAALCAVVSGVSASNSQMPILDDVEVGSGSPSIQPNVSRQQTRDVMAHLKQLSLLMAQASSDIKANVGVKLDFTHSDDIRQLLGNMTSFVRAMSSEIAELDNGLSELSDIYVLSGIVDEDLSYIPFVSKKDSFESVSVRNLAQANTGSKSILSMLKVLYDAIGFSDNKLVLNSVDAKDAISLMGYLSDHIKHGVEMVVHLKEQLGIYELFD